MQLLRLVIVALMFVLGMLFVLGSAILARDKYWTRIWNALGRPEVENTEELGALLDAHLETISNQKKPTAERLDSVQEVGG